MSERRFNFTVKKLEAIEAAPAGKRVEFFDTDKNGHGLGLRVTDTGSKTFFVRRRVAGKPVRTTLGTFPALPLDDARKMAAGTMGAIARGEDPNAARRAARVARTFGELFDWYTGALGQHKPTTLEGYRQTYGKHLAEWGKCKANEITRADVRDLHSTITKGGATYAANRTIALVRAIYNRAIKQDLIDCPNPAIGVQLNREESREVRLLPSQLGAFLDAAESYPDEALRDFFMLALLTGQRKTNILSMSWKDVHLVDRLWIIPDTKNGRPQTVPLLGDEVAILERRRASVAGPWVFPSHGRTGHLVEPKEAWRAILSNAGIKHGELRIHDLRRSFGSLMVDGGESLATIGKALGHMSQLTTAIYARMSLEPVREGKRKVHEVIATARKAPESKVIDLAQRRAGR